MQTPEEIGQGMGQLPEQSQPTYASEYNSESVRDGGWLRWDFLLCLAVATLAAFLLPLEDYDLPIHLRTGAWILDQRQLPVVEPFAWTRAGAPFYAYSWLMEVLYELAWRSGGPGALSAVHALLLAGAVAALWDLARTALWSVWATRLMSSVHLVFWLMVQPSTRPQLVLAIALPMAWAAAYRLQHATTRRAEIGATLRLIVANLLAVNSHLFFFLLVGPMVVLLAAPSLQARKILTFALGTIGGWLCSPNVANLGAMLALYLGPNPVLGSASPIMELEGGFLHLTHAPLGTRMMAGGLLLLPVVPFFAQRTPRERWWYGLLWLAGLALFGLAIRGMVIWWLLTLPLAAWAFASIPLPTLVSTRYMVVACWCLSFVGFIGWAVRAHQRVPRGGGLPHPTARAVAPAVRWLSCAIPTRLETPVRGTTSFNHGSYLTWRLPQLSWSIDGRSIFPDSVARADARQQLRHGVPVSPPWRSGDVILLEAGHATWRDVAADSAWHEVPLQMPDSGAAVRLWVRRTLVDAGRGCSTR